MKKGYEYWLLREDEYDRLKCIGISEELKEEKEKKENETV